MNIDFYSKSHLITDEVKEYIEAKLEKVNSHIPKDATNGRVHVDEDAKHSGEKYTCEMTIHVPGKEFRSESRGTTVYEAIDDGIHKIKRQAEKYKSQIQKNR